MGRVACGPGGYCRWVRWEGGLSGPHEHVR
jgi:hypothetical protein